jgi:hypothetical protein
MAVCCRTYRGRPLMTDALCIATQAMNPFEATIG